MNVPGFACFRRAVAIQTAQDPQSMRRFAVYAVTLFLFNSALAQKPNGAGSQATGNSASPTSAAAATKPDYSQESFVVEQLQTRYRFEADGTGRKEILARIRVQSEAGVEQWGQIVVGYSSANERIEIPYVRVLKADGTTVTAPPDAVQDLTGPVQREAPVYTDYRQKHVTVPGLRPGEVLEYDIVTVIHTPLAAGQFWMDHDFDKNSIVLAEELAIDVPAGRKVKLKTRPGFDAKVTE